MPLHKIGLALLSVALGLPPAGASALGATPATGPTTAPTLPTAPSTPRDALKLLAAALRDGDADRLRALVITSDPVEKRMLGAVADLAGAFAELNRSAVSAFGEEEAGRFTDDSAGRFNRALERIDAADVTVQGDRATVRYADAKADAFELRRVPSTGPAGSPAQWRVPMSELSPGASATPLDDRLAELTAQSKIVKQLAGEIAAGKYKTAEAAEEAWRLKIMQSLPTHPPATGPTTRPTPR